MIEALEILEDYKIIQGFDKEDDDTVEEDIVFLYLAIRLKPLLNVAGINKNRLNKIAELFADNYFDKELSLDLMINALYNYINATKTAPSNRLLSDDIETLLQDYLEE